MQPTSRRSAQQVLVQSVQPVRPETSDFVSKPNFEGREFLMQFARFTFDPGDIVPKIGLHLDDQPMDRRCWSFDHHFNRAISQIADIAHQGKSLGESAGVLAESHPLDPTTKNKALTNRTSGGGSVEHGRKVSRAE